VGSGPIKSIETASRGFVGLWDDVLPLGE